MVTASLRSDLLSVARQRFRQFGVFLVTAFQLDDIPAGIILVRNPARSHDKGLALQRIAAVIALGPQHRQLFGLERIHASRQMLPAR
jgi:hypothetical protein